MTTIEALRELAIKVCGVNTADVSGETVAEVIAYIAEHYVNTKTKTK